MPFDLGRLWNRLGRGPVITAVHALAIGVLFVAVAPSWATQRAEPVIHPSLVLASLPALPTTTTDAPVPLEIVPAPPPSNAMRARLGNAASPPEPVPGVSATPFVLSSQDIVDRNRAISCLTAAIYYEAGVESSEGQHAVAQVVLNRLRHPAYPKTVCGVVFQGSTRATGCQFTFTCDGSLARPPSGPGWLRARKIAEAALDGYVDPVVGRATHYHADYVAPYWGPSLQKVATVGTHIFYRRPGGPEAPRSSYAGREVDPVAAASASDAGTFAAAAVEPSGPAPEPVALESATAAATEEPEAAPLTRIAAAVSLESPVAANDARRAPLALPRDTY